MLGNSDFYHCDESKSWPREKTRGDKCEDKHESYINSAKNMLLWTTPCAGLPLQFPFQLELIKYKSALSTLANS